jgi:tRNA(fMet)-specific endonuclease VapC
MLDTDTVSHIVRRHPSVIKNLIRHEDDEICISAITNAELFYGLEKKGSQGLFNEVRSITGKCSIINFDESQSELYGKIRLELEKKGTPLENIQMIIYNKKKSKWDVLF